jgi:hypothetical protein
MKKTTSILSKTKSKIVEILGMSVGLSGIGVIISQAVAAAYNFTLFESFDNVFTGVQADILEISAKVAGVCGAVCLLILIFSKDDRATQEAWKWGKRIIVCFVLLNSITALITQFSGIKLS